MKDFAGLDPLMENVLRLTADAALLRDNERYASASVLAVIALEEVGKLAHLLWEAQGIKPQSTRSNWHLRKQSAALALTFSSDIADEIVSMLDSGRENDEEAIAALAGRVSRSPAAKRLAAERGLIDNVKKVGLYQDELGNAAQRERVSSADVDELITQAVEAIKAIRSPKALVLGRVVYDTIKGKF